MHNDIGSASSYSSASHDCSVSHDSSVISKSSYSSWFMENHHIIDHDVTSPGQSKQAHDYSESNDDSCHYLEKNDDSIYATFTAPTNKSPRRPGMLPHEKLHQEGINFSTVINTYFRKRIGSNPEKNHVENTIVTKLDDFDFH